MRSPSIAVVTTTIHVPLFLQDYAEDIVVHGRRDVSFIVVADRKTPAEAGDFCASLKDRFGLPCAYLDLPAQERYLQRFPELKAVLPFNSIQRRNIGMLLAYEQGTDILLTVDDDNFLLESDLLKFHSTVGSAASLPAFGSPSGWLDPCRFLIEKNRTPFHHRGFPLEERWKDTEIHEVERTGTVAVNVGFWHGDPDVDAWQRLTRPLETVGWAFPGNFTLAEGTWSPFNSQQTAILREALPAYFLSPHAGRYDDIWASFILHRIAEHLGHMVSYGHPIVSHVQKRSLQSLWNDLAEERMGSKLSGAFAEALRTIPLTQDSYAGCTRELEDGLQSWLDQSAGLGSEECTFLSRYVEDMRLWRETVRRAHVSRVEALPVAGR